MTDHEALTARLEGQVHGLETVLTLLLWEWAQSRPDPAAAAAAVCRRAASSLDRLEGADAHGTLSLQAARGTVQGIAEAIVSGLASGRGH